MTHHHSHTHSREWADRRVGTESDNQWHGIAAQAWHCDSDIETRPRPRPSDAEVIDFSPSPGTNSSYDELTIPRISQPLAREIACPCYESAPPANMMDWQQPWRAPMDNAERSIASSPYNPGPPALDLDIVSTDQLRQAGNLAPMPDFIVHQDGTVEVTPYAQQGHPGSNLLVAVESPPYGQMNPYQQSGLDELVTNLAEWNMQPGQGDFYINDWANLVSPATKDQIQQEAYAGMPMVPPADSLPNQNSNVDRSTPNNDSRSDYQAPPPSHGNHTANGATRPHHSTGESQHYSSPEHHTSRPSHSTSDHSSGGWNGGTMANVLLDWLSALGLMDDPPDYSKVDKLVKTGKLSAKAAKMLHDELPQFKHFAKGLKHGEASLSDMHHFLPKDLRTAVDNGEGLPRDAKLAEQIVRDARSTAEHLNSHGYCFRGVRLTLEKHHIAQLSGRSAWMGADELAKDKDFKELPKNTKLQPGDVVVHGPTKSNEHGHILVYLGNGMEASDHIAKLTDMNYGAWTRVFRPVG